ncbi:MAG: YfjI family protein [Verrucomicrobiota bacterium]|nr:YfjI family protein [Verrucomicrobiota bacterium]
MGGPFEFEDKPAPPKALAPPHPEISEAAFYGLPGRIVAKIAPHTEADRAALLAQFHVAFGNVVGRSAYFVADGARHYTNLFAVIVGHSAKARKGSSLAHINNLFGLIDPIWQQQRQLAGLSSGEGLIWQVRDGIAESTPGEDDGKPGVADKRLLVADGEFAQTLRVMQREGNTLSPVLRKAWDAGVLATPTKNSPAIATGAHISVIGHIVGFELRKLLSESDTVNGLANRFLWICARRSKLLPDGGSIAEECFAEEIEGLQAAVEFARGCEEMERDAEARDLWREAYTRLSVEIPGALGSVLARAEAQTLRLSMEHALLDRSRIIRREHLAAALALWDYCEQSARHVFGASLGDKNADKILASLRAMPLGITRSEISSSILKNNVKADEISRCLDLLTVSGLAHLDKNSTAGRTADRWFATETATKETN